MLAASFEGTRILLREAEAPIDQCPCATRSRQDTATAIVDLSVRGKLELSDSLGRFFPVPSASSTITLEQLLTHTSGLPDACGDDFERLTRDELVTQCLKKLEGMPGPVLVRDSRFALPPKRDVYNSIEGLMNHFKLIMEGIHVPAGEVYQAVEGGNGELGFYIVSDGSGRPYRVRVRPPCFLGMGALNKMLIGRMIPDIITTFGMINMIGGECDR